MDASRPWDGGWMSALRATLVHAVYRSERPWRGSERPEVTVRGALGKALFDVVCVREDRVCAGCPHAQTCVIPTWFEPGLGGQAARPYVMSVQHEPHAVRVGMVWFGPVPRSSALVESLVRVGRGGLGAARSPHVLERLWVHGEGAPSVVVDADRVVGAWPAAAPLARFAQLPLGPVTGARLQLLTPVQLSAPSPTPADVLQAGVHRVRALARAQGVTLPRRWPDWPEGRWEGQERVMGSRYSARHRGRHDLSGWGGELVFDAAIEPFADLLASLELVHVGRGSSAGLGRVRVVWT